MTAFIPGYWMNETSGKLRPAVEAYLFNRPMTPEHFAAMRAYFRQWMQAPWISPMIDVLITKIDEINDRRTLDEWLELAETQGIDPL